MTRFFFDYAANDRSLFDYHGDYFHSARAALEFAEAIAAYLKNSLSDDWIGWSIEVRNVSGNRVGAVSINNSALIATFWMRRRRAEGSF